MKFEIRFVPAIAPFLVISAAAFLLAADSYSERPGSPTPKPGGLTVHEWGTFTSVAGEDGSAIDWDALGGKDDLPGFVNDSGNRCTKWRLTGTVRMETPVLYFYSPRELDAHVKVLFPQGLITEWYPQAEYEVYQKSRSDGSVSRLAPNLNGIDTSLRSLTGGIEWKNIKIQPGTAPALPTESAPSRYYAARGTDATPITVGGQHEKFLFYRGVGRFPVPLSARVSSDGKIVVENRGHDPVPGVILFENRGGRLGYRNAGALTDVVTLERPSLDGSFPQLEYDLENALVAQGLFFKEAQAMVETWRDSWFEEGSRLIYLVPSSAIDAMLPLEVDPAPSQTARVFVGRIELITPETRRSVEEALARKDWATIDRYNRFLDPILKRMGSENPSMASQIERFHIEQAARIQGSVSAGRCR
ncbi:MAG: hypothetical protein LAQ69_00945 [Acidobacteriia bacterium]|nr:hypothetical protein [Terriglobia bacterium]